MTEWDWLAVFGFITVGFLVTAVWFIWPFFYALLGGVMGEAESKRRDSVPKRRWWRFRHGRQTQPPPP